MQNPRTSRRKRYPQTLEEVAKLASRLSRALMRPASSERLAALSALSYNRFLTRISFVGEVSGETENCADDAVRALAFVVSGARSRDYCAEAARLFACAAQMLRNETRPAGEKSRMDLEVVAS